MTLTQITEKGIKDGEIVNADINASAAIAKSKLASLDIVNADINASAAIAGSKISPDFGSQNITTTGNATIKNQLTINSVATASTGTAANMARIDLGNSHFTSDGAEPKIKVWSNAGEHMGFGISGNQLNYITTNTDYDHVFYGGGDGTSELLRIRGSQDYIDIHDNSVLTFGSQAGQIDFNSNNFRFKKISGSGYIHISNNNGDVYLDASGTGDIFLRAGDGSSGIQNSLVINDNGAVNLYHAGAGPKVQTISQGLHINHGNGTQGDVSNLPRITMGSGHLNTDGSECKIKLWDGGSGGSQMGFGISSGQLDYITRSESTSRYDHVFYGGQYGTTELVRIKGSTGNLAFPSGQGIDFSATSDSAGSMSSEVFDDYEEGTFSPILRANGNTTGQVTGVGRYTKVGNVVHCNIDFESVNASGIPDATTTQCTGLPYNVLHVSDNATATTLMSYNVYNANRTNPTFYASGNTNSLFSIYSVSGGAWAHWPTNDINQSTVYLNFSITYFTAT